MGGHGYLDHARMTYTLEEACDLLSLSRSQLYRLLDRGELGSIRVGRARRITSRQLDAFVRAKEGEEGFRG